MSGFVGNLIGSGIVLLLLIPAMLLSKHRHHLQRLHRQASDWGLIIAISLMALAGSVFAYVGAGSWAVSALGWLRGVIGPAGPIVFACIALVLLVTVIVSFIGRPDEKAMGSAFFAPMVFATFSVGLFAHINAYLAPLGQEVATRIGQALGA